jgi:hypothetical protein
MTANIPVNRMARQLEENRGKCAEGEVQQLKGVTADRCTGRAIAILPAVILWLEVVVDCNDKIDGNSVAGHGISNSVYPGCGGSCSCSCSSPRKPYNVKWIKVHVTYSFRCTLVAHEFRKIMKF